MKSIILTLILILGGTLIHAGEVVNEDKPAKGTWDFKMEKLWSVNEAGETPLARISQLKVADNGSVYIHDRKNGKYFIFSTEGEFKKGFGKKGEGPGEVQWFEMARFFLAKDKFIVADMSKIHYFTLNGEFIRSVRNSYFARRPSQFIDENRFITAPVDMGRSKSAESEIKLYDLKNNDEKILAKFSLFKGGTASSGGNRVVMMVRGLTPMITIAYGGDKLFYGMNDKYTINIADLDGKTGSSFSLKREPRKLSNAEIRKQFADDGGRTPKEMLESVIKSMPDTQTFFDKISVHNGLVYVFLSDLNRQNIQKVDIFSTSGKYLYNAQIKIDEGHVLATQPVMHGNYLYIGTQDEEGEPYLNKFKISLPGM
jgi:hypothetical protein